MNRYTFRDLLNNHKVADNQNAFGYVDKDYLTYGDVKEQIKKIKTFLLQAGIGKGDKVALLSASLQSGDHPDICLTGFLKNRWKLMIRGFCLWFFLYLQINNNTYSLNCKMKLPE